MRTRYQQKKADYRVDISEGKEPTPIPLVCPTYVSLPNFTYITDHLARVPPQQPGRIVGCRCTSCGPCCSCTKLANAISEESAEQIIKDGIRSDDNLEPGFDFGIAEVRCSAHCKCSSTCVNKEVSNRSPPKLEIRYVNKDIGFGLFARATIQKNRFIGSYVGELYVRSVFTKFADEHPYYYMVRPQLFKQPVLIDALNFGNYTRFINHSCRPNVFTKNIYAGSNKLLPYPSFFASRKINEGEQIFLDYGPEYFASLGIQCQCGHCSGNAMD
uniref:SET domain-containing protein n=1 Tax=Panagrellus redivivus TaxID=6233 RepID=A0A7E4VZH9_PANRE